MKCKLPSTYIERNCNGGSLVSRHLAFLIEKKLKGQATQKNRAVMIWKKSRYKSE